MWRFWLLLFCCLCGLSAASAHTVLIGALLPPSRTGPSLNEQALRKAVEAVNRNSNRTIEMNFNIANTNYTTLHTLGEDEQSFSVSKRVCQLIEQDVVAILGPRSDALSDHVRSICDHKSVPLLETRWNPAKKRPPGSINVHPHPGTLGKAVTDIVRQSGWLNFSVVYEDNQSLITVQQVLKLTMAEDHIGIRVHKMPDCGADYYQLLRKMRSEGAVNFLVVSSRDNALKFLKQAQMVGMVIEKYSYFFTTLDLHTLPLDDFRYSGTNITGMRLVNVLAPEVFSAKTEYTTEAALTYDAIELLSLGLEGLYGSGVALAGFDVYRTPLSCDTNTAWQHGETLINYMQQVRFDGLTGHVAFDADGLRREFTLDIVQLQEPGMAKIGSWSQNGVESLNYDRPEAIRANQTIIVTTVMKPPYTMLKPSSELRHGNDRYTGICVDLMDKLAEIHGFNYTLIVNPKGTAGKRDENGKWDGMIGDLLDGKAHLAIADLTITASRGEAINFTTQWMSLGISLVFTKPTKQPPSLFSFLAPFSIEVWAYMGMAMVGVSLLMFVLARFSPFEWIPPHPCHADQSTLTNSFGIRNSFWFSCGSVMQQGSDLLPKFSPYEWLNPHPCDDQPEQLENILTAPNSFWFAIGSLMQQGSDIAPKAMSTRMIAGIWWSFTLIMISSYTANLAAFLTIETRYSPIQSAEDLMKPRNRHIKYGLYEKGTTADFFKNAPADTSYKEMWTEMVNKTRMFKNSDKEGIEAVIESNGHFAYFMESSSIEYYVARRCQLTQAGGLLDNKGYGIGVGPQSPYSASELSITIIRLQEEGYLSKLKHKWWKGETGGINCDAKDSTGVTSPLSLKNVGGVFVCLLLGLSLAIVVNIAEFTWAAYKTSREEGVPLLMEMKRELRFVFQFTGNTKPVKRPITGSADTDQEGFIPFSTDSSLQYAPTGYAPTGYSSGYGLTAAMS